MTKQAEVQASHKGIGVIDLEHDEPGHKRHVMMEAMKFALLDQVQK